MQKPPHLVSFKWNDSNTIHGKVENLCSKMWTTFLHKEKSQLEKRGMKRCEK